MKYMGMPWGMWTLFAGSFRAQLTDVLGYNEQTAKAITRRAKAKYKEILRRLPEFEKGDRFKINLVGCAMLGAFVLTMPERPNVDRLTEYYAKAMMTKPMRWFCRKSGEKKFTPQSVAGLQAAAALKAAEIYADALVLAKNVDGVYSADPNKDPNAVRYSHLTYQQVIEQNLQATDLTAITLCKEQKIPVVVCALKDEGAILRAINGQDVGTVID